MIGKHLLGGYHELGTVLGPGDSVVNMSLTQNSRKVHSGIQSGNATSARSLHKK